MKVTNMVLGPISTNTYIAYNEETRECFVVDPAAACHMIVSKIEELELTPVAVLLTHGHFDHIGAADELRARFGIKIYAMGEEKQILETDNNLGHMIRKPLTLSADEFLCDGEELTLIGENIRVIGTPGHTIGSCCYYIQAGKTLFSGDTLFCNSHGRYDFPTGSYSDIISSIKDKLLKLPDDVRVLPGHGDETTIGFERGNY